MAMRRYGVIALLLAVSAMCLKLIDYYCCGQDLVCRVKDYGWDREEAKKALTSAGFQSSVGGMMWTLKQAELEAVLKKFGLELSDLHERKNRKDFSVSWTTEIGCMTFFITELDVKGSRESSTDCLCSFTVFIKK